MGSLVRKHSLSGGTIDKLTMASIYGNMMVTAVRTGSGALKLIVWQVVGDELQRKGDVTAGPMVDVAAVHTPDNKRVATTCCDTSGNLALGIWDVTPEGQIKQVGAASAGAIKMATSVSLGKSVMATPLIDSAGNLKVIAWAISDNDQLTRLGDASAGAATLVSSYGWSEGRFVTAVRDGGGNLKLIQWAVTPTGKVERMGDAGAGAISEVDIIRNHEYGSLYEAEFFTAVRDASGSLKLIAWRATAEGPIERIADLVLEPGTRPAMEAVGFGRHAVAFRDAAGRLKLTCFMWGWQSSPSNPGIPTHQGFEVLEEAVGGAASAIAVARGTYSGPVKFVTAVRAGNGDLKMILWQVQ